MIYKTLFAFFFFALNLTPYALSAEPAPYGKNAGCLIVHRGRALLVEDNWSYRWSPPAGGPERNETAAETAVRETYEETGVRAKTHELLETFEGKLYLYRCVPTEPISSVENYVPLPPYARNEVTQARFMDPSTIKEKNWRFPKQAQRIVELLRTQPSLSDTLVQEKTSRRLEATPLQARSIALSEWLQSFTAEKSSARAMLTEFMKSLSGLVEESVLFLLFALFWLPRFGMKGPRITLIYIFSLLMTSLVKDFLQQPRPFEFLPHLQLHHSSGFGMPSGHSQTALLVFGMIALEFSAQRRKLWALAAIVTLLVGLSRLYLGVHFVQDVLLGYGIAAAILLLWATQGKALTRLFSQSPAWLWWVVGAWLFVPALYFQFQPYLVSSTATVMGLLTGFTLFRKSYVTKRLSGLRRFFANKKNLLKEEILFFAITAVGLFTLSWAIKKFWPTDGAFNVMLAGRVVRYYVLGLWLSSVRRFL